MVWAFRTLLLVSFALFWGGLTFYTGFVVRISHDVLNDPMDGGLITQRVTAILQVLGAVAFVLMLANAVFVFRRSRTCGYALLGCSSIFACALIGLFIVHWQLDTVIDVGAAEISDPAAFDTGHRRYNRLTTLEWLASLAYLPVTVIAWRAADGEGPAQDDS